MTARRLHVLILEDSVADAELILAELRRAGFEPDWERVDTEEDFRAALSPDLDIILSDFSMPTFDGLRAVEILKRAYPEVPFVIISGTVGEETAVRAMRAGTDDYLLKDRLARLGMAVTRALERRRGVEARERAEEDLKEREGLYRAIVEGTTDAIYLKDREGRYVAMNSAGSRLVGRPVAEILGETDDALFPPEDVRRVREMDESVMAEGEPRTYESTSAPGGKERTFSTTKAPWRDGKGEIIGILGISRDITERRSLERALRQSQKMEAVGRLAGGVAHDFNNLLTAILGYGELVQMQTDDPGVRASVDEILQAAHRGAALTRQLLAFGRRQKLAPERLDVNEVVRGVESLLRRLIGEDVAIRLEPAAGTLPVEADRNQLEQVLLNLAVNARDAMPDGGTLTLATGSESVDETMLAAEPEVRPGRYVWLRVRDTGIGMDAETQAQIFEPFFTTKEAEKGTGLGLATVFGVVKQSGGFIRVWSEVGRGAELTMYLPEA